MANSSFAPDIDVHKVGVDYVLCDGSLLTNHRILKHKAVPAPVARHTNTKDVRNTAITLLESIQLDITTAEKLFDGMAGDTPGLRQAQFVHFAKTLTNNELQHTSLSALYEAINIMAIPFLSWNDMLAYIIDAGLQGPVGRATETINKYMQSQIHIFHRCSTQYVAYLPQSKKFFTVYDLVTSTSKDRFLRIGTLQKMMKASQIPVPHSSNCFAYSPELSMLLLGGMDMRLRVWWLENTRVYRNFDVLIGDNITAMRFDHETYIAYLGTSAGGVFKYRIEREGPPTCMFATYPHNSSVTSMMLLPLDGAIVTGASKGTLLIQDPEKGSVIVTYGSTRSSILDISMGPDANSFYTCGFDKAVQFWSVSSQPRPPIIFLDEETPHAPPIIRVQALEGTSQLFTLDNRGLLKLWDVRTLRCVQNINVGSILELGVMEFHNLTVRPHERILHVAARHGMVTYKYSTIPVGSSITGTETIIDATFHEGRNIALTVTQSQLLLWEWGTYSVAARYESLTRDEVLCFNVADTRVYLGQASGIVNCHNASNGQKLWSCVVSRGKEINEVVQVARNALLALDGKNVLWAILEEGIDRQIVTRADPRDKVKCLDYAPVSNLVVYGTTVMDVQVSRPHVHKDFTLLPQHRFTCRCDVQVPRAMLALGLPAQHLTCCVLLHPYPIVAAGTSTGEIQLWTIRPHPSPGVLVATIRTDKQAVYGVTALAFASECFVLCAGCENGHLQTFALYPTVAPVLARARLDKHEVVEKIQPIGELAVTGNPIDKVHYVASKSCFIVASNDVFVRAIRVDAVQHAAFDLEAAAGQHNPADEQVPRFLVEDLIEDFANVEVDAYEDEEEAPVHTYDLKVRADDDEDRKVDMLEKITRTSFRRGSMSSMGSRRGSSTGGFQTTLSMFFSRRLSTSSSRPSIQLSAQDATTVRSGGSPSNGEDDRVRNLPEPVRAMHRIEGLVDAQRERVVRSMDTSLDRQKVMPQLPVFRLIPVEEEKPQKKQRPPRMLRDKSDLLTPSRTAQSLRRLAEKGDSCRSDQPSDVGRPTYFACSSVGAQPYMNPLSESVVYPARVFDASTPNKVLPLPRAATPDARVLPRGPLVTPTTTRTNVLNRAQTPSVRQARHPNRGIILSDVMAGTRCGTPLDGQNRARPLSRARTPKAPIGGGSTGRSPVTGPMRLMFPNDMDVTNDHKAE
eukprot:PhM_4_TR11377/c1_g1_i1/m.4482